MPTPTSPPPNWPFAYTTFSVVPDGIGYSYGTQQNEEHDAEVRRKAVNKKKEERREQDRDRKRTKRSNDDEYREQQNAENKARMKEKRATDDDYREQQNAKKKEKRATNDEYREQQNAKNKARMKDKRQEPGYAAYEAQYREANRWKKRANDRKRHSTEEYRIQDRARREAERERRQQQSQRRRQDQEVMAREAEQRAIRTAQRQNASFSTANAKGLQCNMNDINTNKLNVTLRYFGQPVVKCHFCGAMGWDEEDKGTKAQPHFGKQCCMQGKYGNKHTSFRNPSGDRNIHLPEVPPYLKGLLTGEDRLSKYFRKHIRSINAGMTLGSVKMNDKSERGAPSTFKISGQLMRFFGSLLKPTSEPKAKASCAQIYFYDPRDQVEIRLNRLNGGTGRNKQYDTTLFTNLLTMLTTFNSLVRQFKTVHEYINDNNLNAEELRIQLHESKLLPSEPGNHPGAHHIPSVDEMALIMPNSMPRDAERSIVCAVRATNTLQSLITFPHTHGKWDPCGYPLLFPYGTSTWHQHYKTSHRHEHDITTRVVVNLSLNMFFRHMTRWRDEDDPDMDYFNHLQRCGRLWQQYIVDTWARVEMNRLIWNRTNQATLRADVYKGVQDSMNRGDGEDGGLAIILPATYFGSQRWYHNKFQNAMALCREFGKPTFFLTFTLDINCAEVQEQLRGEGSNAYDRPELLCRVFNMKQKAILKEIKEGLFGPLIAHSAVIEFQKRGAPHSHILLWVKDFPCTPEMIDNVISAEIPDKNVDPELHELVVQKMIHGPCGANYNRTNLGCIQNSTDGNCVRHYPFAFQSETTVDEGSFAKYRRRSPQEGGFTATKWHNGVQVPITNEWVVPYSPYLLKKYGVHVNLECCATLSAIKYLFGYNFKGQDMITVEERYANDEIRKYETQRYISATNAIWRLYEYEVATCEPTVYQLQVHLPQEQRVVYTNTRQGMQEAAQRNERTMLTAYFEKNAEDNDEGRLARSLPYESFGTKFTWDSTNKFWGLRVRGYAVARMVTIHPSCGDKFYLHLLLKHKKGATSFDDLKTVDGVCHETFKGACVALDLCEDDSQWIECLEEAEATKMPGPMRQLFCNILTDCHPTSPREIFDRFSFSMSEDFLHNLKKEYTTMSEEWYEKHAYNKLLIDLNRILQDVEKSTASFDLDEPDETMNEELRPSNHNVDEIDDEATAHFEANEPLLTSEQRCVYDKITQCVNEDKGGAFRFDASGGCGKTFVSNVLLSYVRKDKEIAIACALSGIAATLLRLGTTFHRRWRAPIPCFEDSMPSMKLDSEEANVIRAAKLIIIDEVSMMHVDLFNMTDRMLRTLMKKDELMGGKLVLFMHDFKQLLPVVPGGSKEHILNASVFNSEVWGDVTKLELSNNMRVQRLIDKNPERESELRSHAQWLLDLGNGDLPCVYQNIIEVPERMVCQTPEELESKVYNDLMANYDNPSYLYKRAIMSTTNDIIQSRNFDIIQRLPGELIVSQSIDECIEDKHKTMYPVEYLNKINVSGIPPHRLALKKGACIILIRNLNVSRGHCNGTRYLISDLTPRLIVAKRLSDGEILLIPRIPMISKDSSFPADFKRLQFPVLGAYYLSINRAQGQSLDKAGIYLEKSCFGHGMLYVAASRVGDFEGTYAYINQSEFSHLRQHLDEKKTYTRNVVYKECFMKT